MYLINLPKKMMLPAPVAQAVFDMLTPYLGNSVVASDWSSETLRYMTPKELRRELTLEAVTPNMLASVAMNESNP
jgi:hypothetical protein